MKPTTEFWTLMKHITEIHQKTYIQARLNVWGKEKLICECECLETCPTRHIFFECTNENIQFQRCTLWILVELYAPDEIKTSTKTTQMLWLLGKPYNNEKKNIVSPQLLAKTADLIFNAVKLLSKQQ